MGIHFFRNAMDGGDWIIQEQLENSTFLATLLPENAPTSTFRVITASKGGLKALCEIDGGEGVGMDIGMDIDTEGAQVRFFFLLLLLFSSLSPLSPLSQCTYEYMGMNM